jgi:hypothetical protein
MLTIRSEHLYCRITGTNKCYPKFLPVDRENMDPYFICYSTGIIKLEHWYYFIFMKYPYIYLSIYLSIYIIRFFLISGTFVYHVYSFWNTRENPRKRCFSGGGFCIAEQVAARQHSTSWPQVAQEFDPYPSQEGCLFAFWLRHTAHTSNATSRDKRLVVLFI